MKPILLSAPVLRGNEEKYVLECLRSGWVSASGEFVGRFEKGIASYVGTNGVVAATNGTAALHICLLLAGVGPGDEVIVPTLTFIAPVNAVRYVGAEPVFMDCDDHLNLDMAKLAFFLTEECELAYGKLKNRRSGRDVKAIVPVHVFGAICDMDQLMALARRFDLPVIEDATEALGSRMTSGESSGKFAGTIGDFGCYSFNGNKIITCGGGGMIVARNDDALARAKYLTTQAKDDKLHYVHHEVGYNYRLTAIQAAVGLAQFERLDEFISIKEGNYHRYQKEIASIRGLSILPFPKYCRSNRWFYSLVIDSKIYPLGRDDLLARFEEASIQVRPIWKLNHTQKPYANSQAYRIERAPSFVDRILNLPCSVDLTEEQVGRVVRVLKSHAG